MYLLIAVYFRRQVPRFTKTEKKINATNQLIRDKKRAPIIKTNSKNPSKHHRFLTFRSFQVILKKRWF